MIVFHHNDMDGRCSGFIAGHFMGTDRPETAVSYVEMNYDKQFPFDTVEANGLVFIVDFSLEPKDMVKLLEITESVFWIDHHGTAIRKYEREWRGEEIPGLRSESEAGCVLTYWFCTEYFTGVRARYVPMFIRLIGDRDIWRYKYGDRSRLFHRGLLAEDTSPTSSIWQDIWGSTKSMEKQGIPVGKFLAQDTREVILQNGFWTEFCGHECYAVNSTMRSSEYFEKYVPDAIMWVSFRFTGECWTVSLYSTKIDVSKIAEKFQYEGKRGGGHKGAAGFQCYYPPFLPSSREVARNRISEKGVEVRSD